MEENFSTDQGAEGAGFRMIQIQYTQAYLLLYSPVPNRPGLVLVHSLKVEDPCSNSITDAPDFASSVSRYRHISV